MSFIDDGILVSGTIDDKYFEFKLSDIFCFLGFGTTNQKYHINSSLEKYVTRYENLRYLVKIEQKNDSTFNISKDTFIILMIEVNTLLEIDSLNIIFKDSISTIDDSKIESVCNFVDFVMKGIPDDMFVNYHQAHKDSLMKYIDYELVKEKVDFDPVAHLSINDFVFIYEIFIGADNPLIEKIKNGEILDEDTQQDFDHYLKYIKFAWGAKHGYIKIDNNWSTPLEDNYAPEFNIDPIEDFCGEDFEVLSTEYIYKAWDMDTWIHLLP
jgi:hypothetical protein